MQKALDLWNQFSDWFSSQWAVFRMPPDEVWRGFVSALVDGSLWLQSGNKGLIIVLILLVVIVNRILKRQD